MEILGRKENLCYWALLGRVFTSYYPFKKNTPNSNLELFYASIEGIEKALTTLTKKEYWVLINRFGLHGHKILTLKETGELDEVMVNPERVRQIEAKALRKLRGKYATIYGLLK